MTLMGLGVSAHPGSAWDARARIRLEACDLLIAAGVRFDDRATGKVAEFCPKAKVIHIDIDEVGKSGAACHRR